ncbi:hypothetical protein QAD02_024401 [Eretmocerus hayati]|uniref:Uncharacterized protein n=1 Tax=Eretmocerus hayati TaxID=131215 RepID=A0ACC2Q092_9HYME|nr:hypothetical protein QAD02_024401 [Eretmocerus hayati]
MHSIAQLRRPSDVDYDQAEVCRLALALGTRDELHRRGGVCPYRLHGADFPGFSGARTPLRSSHTRRRERPVASIAAEPRLVGRVFGTSAGGLSQCESRSRPRRRRSVCVCVGTAENRRAVFHSRESQCQRLDFAPPDWAACRGAVEADSQRSP